MGGSSLPRNKADKATRPDRTATAAGPPGRGGHTQTAALRPPSCGPHSWPLTHSFQTVGSTLKPGDPTPGPAAGSSAFPTSLLLQETGRGSGRSGCWNLRAAPDSQIDQCLVWPLWLDPDPDGSVTARNKEPCFLLHNMERFTRSSWLILSLALLSQTLISRWLLIGQASSLCLWPEEARGWANAGAGRARGAGTRAHRGPDASGFAPRDALPGDGGCRS